MGYHDSLVLEPFLESLQYCFLMLLLDNVGSGSENAESVLSLLGLWRLAELE